MLGLGISGAKKRGTKIILIFLFFKKTNAPGRTARARSDRLQAPTILELAESFPQGLETPGVFNACGILGEGTAATEQGGEQLFGGKKSLRNASIPTGPRGPLPRIGFAAESRENATGKADREKGCSRGAHLLGTPPTPAGTPRTTASHRAPVPVPSGGRRPRWCLQ